jgi:hypothetical protein
MATTEIIRVVDSMRPEDILNVFRQDIPFINHTLEKESKRYAKALYPNRKEPLFFKPLEFQRKDGLNIVLQYFDKSNKYPKNKRLGVWQYMWFNYHGGMSFLRIFPTPEGEGLFYFYTSHFVDRYRERFLKDVTLSKKEAFSLFLQKNPKRLFKNVPSAKYEKSGWMMVTDGLCFVEVKSNNFIIVKTFIPWTYLKKEQIVTLNSIGQEVFIKGFEVNLPWELLSEEDIKFD